MFIEPEVLLSTSGNGGRWCHMVTYEALFQFGMLLVAFATLLLGFKKK
jgi:hypothetical protein